MPPRNSRDALLEKRRKVDAQIKALDARTREQRRKDETRRKIILGGLVMAEMEDNADLRVTIRRLIEEKAGERDHDFLADWLASVAVTPHEEVASPATPLASRPAPEPPQGEARKSSLILPGQDREPTPGTKPSIIMRP